VVKLHLTQLISNSPLSILWNSHAHSLLLPTPHPRRRGSSYAILSTMKFQWDPAKARGNVRKHGVSFDEAVTVFKDPLALIFDDTEHSEVEAREIIIGMSTLSRMLLVCFVERREDTVRIISARPATHTEKKDYEANAKNQNP